MIDAPRLVKFQQSLSEDQRKELDVALLMAQEHERERIAAKFSEEAADLPLGVEDPQRGCALYNWYQWAIAKIKASK